MTPRSNFPIPSKQETFIVVEVSIPFGDGTALTEAKAMKKRDALIKKARALGLVHINVEEFGV